MLNFSIYINMSDETYRIVGKNEYFNNIKKVLHAFEFLREIANEYVHEDWKNEAKAWLEKSHIKALLKDRQAVSKDFPGRNRDEWIRSIFTVTEADKDGKPLCIVYGCEGIADTRDSALVQRIQLMEAEKERNRGIRISQDNAIRQFMDLLIKTEDGQASIDELIKLTGRYFDADRSYICEIDETGRYVVNTFEWCAEGVNPEKDNLQQVPVSVTEPWMAEFRKRGSFYISCDDEYAEKEPIVYEVLQPQDITSLMEAPLIRSGDIIGFLGVDNPKINTEQELFLSVAASVLNHEVLSISEHKKEEKLKKALQQSMEDAQAANVAKTSFLFNMSHDIRTPINAIMGFRTLLEKHQDEPKKRADYLQKIGEASHVLLSIINNVLEMARIENATLDVNETVCCTEDFMRTVFSVFKEMMAQKGLKFTSSMDIQHNYVFCDTTKLREILFNILSNAYKYTNEGGSVDIRLEEVSSEKEGWLIYRTTVTDTGIGMSRDFQMRIFEEFSRESNTTETKIEGTGLGMPIVKRLVELLGGTIEVQSERGKGSAFTVAVPHRIADEKEFSSQTEDIQEIDPSVFYGKRILLAEDNDLNAEIAIEILKEQGLEVERAIDGQMCVDMLEKSEPGYYSMILMDVQMPNMNGYEATRAIRALKDDKKKNIKIVAMTANAFEEDKREALKNGMNGHLAKPVNIYDLMKELVNAVTN